MTTRWRAIISIAGGGFGPDAEIGQEVYRDVKAEDAPKAVEKLLKAYRRATALPPTRRFWRFRAAMTEKA